MRGYDLAAWEPFFSAIIAAAAALTGRMGPPGRDRPLTRRYPAATALSSMSNSSSAVRPCRP